MLEESHCYLWTPRDLWSSNQPLAAIFVATTTCVEEQNCERLQATAVDATNG
jgi:hypothetical protein